MYGESAEAFLWRSVSCGSDMNVCEPHELMLSMLLLQVGFDAYTELLNYCLCRRQHMKMQTALQRHYKLLHR